MTGSAPVPDRLTVCGEPAALSVTVSDPVVAPVQAGENVTAIVQVAPTAKEEPQLLVSEKPLLAAIEVIAKGAVPGFASVKL